MPDKETILSVLDALCDEVAQVRDIAEALCNDDDADRLTEIVEALIDVLAYVHTGRNARALLRRPLV